MSNSLNNHLQSFTKNIQKKISIIVDEISTDLFCRSLTMMKHTTTLIMTRMTIATTMIITYSVSKSLPESLELVSARGKISLYCPVQD